MLYFFLLVVLWAWIEVYCNAENRVPSFDEVVLLPPKIHDFSTNKDSGPPIIPTVANTYIFRLHGKWTPSSDLKHSRLDLARAQFRHFLDKARIDFVFLYVYSHGPEGFAAAFRNPNEVQKVEEMDLNFLSVILPDRMYTADHKILYGEDVWTHESIVQIPRNFMQLPAQRNNAYVRGKGVKVAVLDQGIRFTEDPFIVPGKICVNPGQDGCRVKKILDFVHHEKMKRYSDSNSIFEPSYDGVMDVYGDHGTEMASLIGGTSELGPGVAQEVEFYDFRIVDKSCTFSRILAAIAYAVKYEADIISLSIGGIFGLGLYFGGPLLKPTLGEIIFTSSMGNKGESELLFQPSDFSKTDEVVSTGSFQNPLHEFFQLRLQWMYQKVVLWKHTLNFYELRRNSFAEFTGRQIYAFVYCDPHTMSNYRSLPVYTMFSGIFILLPCSSEEECLALVPPFEKDEKILGIVFLCVIDLQKSRFNQVSLPVAYCTDFPLNFEAKIELASFAIGSMKFDYVYALDTEHKPSSLSSYGPSPLLKIKPDLSFIGCGIRIYRGGRTGIENYRIAYGTSNANAISAGVIALDIEHRKKKQLEVHMEDVITRMRNTGKPAIVSDTNSPLKGYAYSVLKQGSGLAQVQAMLESMVLIFPSKIELGYHFVDDENDPNSYILTTLLTLYNIGRHSVVYELKHLPAVAIQYSTLNYKYLSHKYYMKTEFSIGGFHVQGNKIMLSTNSILNLEIKFHIDPRTPLFIFLSGYIQFFPKEIRRGTDTPRLYHPEYTPLSIPYLLFYGNLYEFPILEYSGERASFLTSAQIKFFSDQMNSAYPLRNRPDSVPAYFFTSINVGFTFQGHDRPMLCMCPLMELKQLDFYLLTYFSNERLGRIRSYKHVAPKCSLFLFHRHKVLEFGETAPPEIDSPGWDGTYTPDIDRGKVKQVSPGKYRICAKGRLELDPLSIPFCERQYDWCSVSFQLGSD